MTRWRIVVGLALLAVVAGMAAVYHPDRNPVLGTVALGRGSYMLVVDARSARAFVGVGNRVHVLDTATGKLLRTVTVAPSAPGVRATLLAVDEQMGRVVVLTEPFLGLTPLMGYVGVLDARGGQLLHTTPVSVGNTSWLAVDAQAGRAVVVGIPDYLGLQAAPDPARDPVRVSVLDVGSGHLVRTARLSLPRQPLSGWGFADSPFAIDGRSGRIFVSRFDGARISDLDATTGRVVRTVCRP